MPFKDLVEAAKKVPDIDFRRAARATTTASEQEIPVVTEPQVGVNAIAQQLEGEKSAAMEGAPAPSVGKQWESCEFKRKGERMNLCTQFFSKCAEEKCHKRYIK